jgi:hypothetical protein
LRHIHVSAIMIEAPNAMPIIGARTMKSKTHNRPERKKPK